MGRPISYNTETMPRREAILQLTVERWQPLRVVEDDAFLLPGLQWEDAHLERRAVHPFEQGRIFLPINHALVHIAGVIALGHPAFHQLAVHVHGEAREGSIGRQREDERTFEPLRRV